MDFNQTLAHVEELLGCLPKVKVVSLESDGAEVRFTLIVRSQESLARLASMSLWAHLGLGVTIDYPDDELYSDPKYLRHVLTVPADVEQLRPRTPLQWLGIFLARELTALELLDPAESKRLQKAWDIDPA